VAASVASMGRRVRLQELLVGVEGLALLRHLYDGTDDAADRRLEEVRRVLAADALGAGESIDEVEPRVGYGAWSEVYDDPANPIIALEQPAVWSVVESFAPGRALDAACGTGRHARRLVELDHDVLGIDLTPEMLERAVLRVPKARFLEADLLRIPVTDEELDLVVCGLALSHLADLRAGIAELARVLRPGGRLVISVLHPFQAHLGWHAPFTDPSGERGFICEHAHRHADYLAAFRATGLELRDCLEPVLSSDQLRAKRRAFEHIPDATAEAYLGLPGVLIWSTRKA
jgi:SAM-dependent methyltransferase